MAQPENWWNLFCLSDEPLYIETWFHHSHKYWFFLRVLQNHPYKQCVIIWDEFYLYVNHGENLKLIYLCVLHPTSFIQNSWSWSTVFPEWGFLRSSSKMNVTIFKIHNSGKQHLFLSDTANCICINFGGGIVSWLSSHLTQFPVLFLVYY